MAHLFICPNCGTRQTASDRQRGFIKRTPRGRVATAAAWEHLGLEQPRGAASLF